MPGRTNAYADSGSAAAHVAQVHVPNGPSPRLYVVPASVGGTLILCWITDLGDAVQDGLDQQQLIDWLLGEWKLHGPPVALVEGFSGIGKTELAHRLARAWGARSIMVTATDGGATFEDVLFDIAAGLEQAGDKTVADHADGDYRAGALELMRGPALIVIDDFQELLDPSSRQPSADIVEFCKGLAQINGLGRLLLVTGQSPAYAPWMESIQVRTMSPPRLEAAEAVLAQMLASRGLAHEVPTDQLSEVVAWLGRNPRAMQAFVACLRDEPLEELISMDPDTWALKDQTAAPTLVARLEQMFLARTLERLDPASALLLESLGVYRKPFSVEAIGSASSHGANVSHVKDELTSRFLLLRDRKWYTLNPVARQLAMARLEQDPRRMAAAHSRAADHFVRRSHADGPRALIRSGAEFVEARFHLLKSGREDDFQNLAGDYRRLLLQNFQHLTEQPSTAEHAHEVVSILLAALGDSDDGYFKLRGVLARLLVRRDRQGDQVIALRQSTIATRGVRDHATWILRAELTHKLDSAAALVAVADQSLDRAPSSVAAGVCCRVAELLAQRNQDDMALSVTNRGLDRVNAVDKQRLYTTAGFILNRAGRSSEAVTLLQHGYVELGEKVALRYRLFEEAAFIAFQNRDIDALQAIRSMVISDGRNADQSILVEMLVDQIQGHYLSAAQRADGHLEYFAVAAQASFCWLVSGDVSKAVDCLESGRYLVNPANAWLRALVALCQDAPEIYVESMSDCLGRALSAADLENRDLWVEAWDRVPHRLGIFPSFYFPVLPSGLTQLDHDISRRVRDGSVLDMSSMGDIRLPRGPESVEVVKPVNGGLDDLPFLTRDHDGALHFHIYPQERRVMNTYNNYGQAGAFGENAKSEGASFQQIAGAVSDPRAVEELRQLLNALRQGPASAESSTAIKHVEGAVAAGEANDSSGMLEHLKGAGEWTLKKAGEIGAEIAAAVIRRSMGLE